jgi:YHS domain-containing protein
LHKGFRDRANVPGPVPGPAYHTFIWQISKIVRYPKGGRSMATDPVCFMIVDEDTAQFRSTYRDTEYYFCCNYCKKQFDANPKRYSRLANDMTVDLGSGCE